MTKSIESSGSLPINLATSEQWTLLISRKMDFVVNHQTKRIGKKGINDERRPDASYADVGDQNGQVLDGWLLVGSQNSHP